MSKKKNSEKTIQHGYQPKNKDHKKKPLKERGYQPIDDKNTSKDNPPDCGTSAQNPNKEK